MPAVMMGNSAMLWYQVVCTSLMPQTTMITAIHLRAPNLDSARLLGTWKKKYPAKKIPAPT